MMRKGQVMLFSLFLLLIVGVLASGLANLWQSQVSVTTAGKDGLTTFYLAQRALEYAKVMLAADENWPPPADPGGSITFTCGLGTCDVTVTNIVNPAVGCPASKKCRQITATATFEAAQKRLRVRVTLSPLATTPRTWQEM